MSWLTGWNYRKSITLSRSSGAVTNYQMKLLVGESSGATGEDVDCGGLCLSTFNDIRFTKSDGTTLLDYWIESITGTSPNQLATVWIEFDSIGTSATTFYMYYGNSSASAASSGDNTFIFFDHFDYSWSGQTKWSGDTGSASINTSILSMVGANAVKQIVSNIDSGQVNCALRAYAKVKDLAASYDFVGLSTETRSHHAIIYNNADNGIIRQVVQSKDGTTSSRSTSNWTSDLWRIYDILVVGGTKSRYLQNGTELTGSPKTTNPPNTNLKAAIAAYKSDSVVQLDWVLIRKYEDTEPSWGTWGSQESSGLTIPPLAADTALTAVPGLVVPVGSILAADPALSMGTAVTGHVVVVDTSLDASASILATMSIVIAPPALDANARLLCTIGDFEYVIVPPLAASPDLSVSLVGYLVAPVEALAVDPALSMPGIELAVSIPPMLSGTAVSANLALHLLCPALAGDALLTARAPLVFQNILLVTHYEFVLTGTADGLSDVTIPISSFQCRLKSGAPSYLSVVIPGLDYAAAIAARPNGDLQVYMIERYRGGHRIREKIAEVDLDDVRIDKGTGSKSITLTGYRTVTYDPKAMTLEGAAYGSTIGGKRRYRCLSNLYLNPGDTVTVDDETFTADEITMAFSVGQKTMEVTEK